MQVDWLNTLNQVVDLILVSLVGLVVAYVVSWLRVKKQELLEKVKDETTRKYLELLDKIIYECVLSTNQTYVSALKDAGTFNEEAHKKAFQLTYDSIFNVLTDDVQKHLNEVVKDLPTFISTKIEAQVGLNHR